LHRGLEQGRRRVNAFTQASDTHLAAQRTCALATRSLVELLPQSSAATTSATHVHHEQFGHANVERDECTDGSCAPVR